MDPLQRFVSGPRAQGVFSLHVSMRPPWCVDVDDRAPLTVVAATTGSTWLVHSTEPPALLEPGTVALLAHGRRYFVADEPKRAPTVRIGPGQVCEPMPGSGIREADARGLLTWGNADDGPDQLLIGTYEARSMVGDHVTAALPDLAVLAPGAVDPALLDLLRRELTEPGAGHGMVVDRLLDLIVCMAVRAAADSGSGWLSGTTDPVVAGVLDLIHGAPAEPWTLDRLADAVHVSRATMAARFRTHVGCPPGDYLIRWRIALAADALTETDLPLTAIAERVGYATPFALSTAFTRVQGTSPASYRADQRLSDRV
ncbi:AraC family transcriptional regulator [Tsukamurella sp. 8F]|uniref:AraC family transcriptional regulator n=1 Tax=unclassified Tsukamurella TaxID=2633480 RepID=UPI0023B9313B|nr:MULTISPECIES: AraC family transcriptional regulator [unclassified Tsukamurella]MDF0530145.1 AraC family transcriptional regulator [Tsukamurella sp. 8J]MDF0586463.1 AraC family transcriptional regulator [Tsukamurella sp. 8F]